MWNTLRVICYVLIFSFHMGNCDAIGYSHKMTEKDINQTDNAGLKQGRWVISENGRVVEEGDYVNDLKEGIWKAYHSNHSLKHEITFVKGEAKGDARFYYKDGTLRESGNWQVDHWEGSYKYYFESGQLSYDWFYNEHGKRQGEQTYFYTNGKKMYEGHWEEGKTQGILKVYDDTGKLIQEKVFKDGQIDTIKKPTSKPQAANSKFTGTGFHTIYTLTGQIDQKGFFVKGKLFNGVKHHYNAQGKVTSTTTYKNGNIVE